MTTFCSVVPSPIGPLTLSGSGDRLSGLYMTDGAHNPPSPAMEAWERDDARFASIAAQLDAYFDGSLTEFDVALEMIGTPFQQRVWNALRTIPYGETASYAEIARSIGSPTAYRAVGLANGRNPVGLIVPCHRVIGASGSLVGYGGGLDRKRWLLDHEAKVSGTAHVLESTR